MTRASSPRPPRVPAGTTFSLPAGNRLSRRTSPGMPRRLIPTIARWPLEVDEGFETSLSADAAVATVRQCLAEYRSGRADAASRAWHDDIVWTVRASPPVSGEWTRANGVFEYHGLLERMSGGTFRQRLVALEGSRGSIVNAYLRTTAARRGRQLDIPTLAVFELAGGRVRRVTELPGDQAAWAAFWSD